MKLSTLLIVLASSTNALLCGGDADPSRPQVIDHAELQSFLNQGNTLTGIATPSLGAVDCEVWHSSIAPHSCTPLHQHECQEVFIFLRGEGKALVGAEEVFFKAPCTLLLPACVPHQIFNTGDEPSEQIVVLKSRTEIYNAQGSTMNLPWRK